MNQIDLKGRRAVVTGAAQGIGLSITQRLLASGAQVCLWDQDAALLEETCEVLAGSPVSSKVVDVTDSDTVAAAAQQTASDLGGIDILVNNAGYSHRNKQFSDVTDEEFDKVYDVNVKAVFIAIQEALPVLRERGGGCIINTSSTAALRPRPGLAVYCSSKGAVSNLTKALAVELAPDKVRVNAICPVIGETGMLETFMGVPDTPENRKKFEATIPLGRFSTPNDIAQTMLFLASDDAAFLTGVALEVDGGRCV